VGLIAHTGLLDYARGRNLRTGRSRGLAGVSRRFPLPAVQSPLIPLLVCSAELAESSALLVRGARQLRVPNADGARDPFGRRAARRKPAFLSRQPGSLPPRR
jgi:hypothetical protein